MSEKSGASTPPGRRDESGLRDAEGASGCASESIDDGGRGRMSAAEGGDDEGMIRPVSERDDLAVFHGFA